MGHRTPLYGIHRSLKAKIVNFGGWDMPLHYGSQIQEHHAVRQRCGLFDVSHMTIVDVVGQDALAYLRYLLANDVAKLGCEQALYSCMLNERGGILDDLIVYKLKHAYRLVLNCSTRDKNLQWMRIQQQTTGLTVDIVERTDLAMLALQGPESEKMMSVALPNQIVVRALAMKSFYSFECDDFHVSRTGYTGEKGFEIILPNHQAEEVWTTWCQSGVEPIGLGARDTLRLEAGMHLYGSDMDESVSPLECGLDWTVNWDSPDRAFLGRDALVKQKSSGVELKCVGLVLRDRGILRSSMVVRFHNGAEGVVTSGTFAPSLGCSIALARVPISGQGMVQVYMRNQWRTIEVVKPTFIRFGKSLLQPQ